MTKIDENHKMKYFDKWAENKSPLLRFACLTLASSAEDCYSIIQMAKSGEPIENILYLPPINRWLNLYRNHRRLYKGVTGAIRELGKEMSAVVDFYELIIDNFNQVKKMTYEEKQSAVEKLSPKEYEKIVNDVRKIEKELELLILEFNKNDNILIEARDEKEEKKKARKFIHTPEITFYFKVWLPCFLIHGEYPQNLLMKARHRDDEAIQKLLQIDKSVIDDPKIKEIFHQSAVASQKSKYALMIKAIQEGPKKRVDIKTVKYTLAGLISLISIALKQEIKPEEISELFNAIACDSKKDVSGDDDITVGETFRKAVERNRTFWQINFKKT